MIEDYDDSEVQWWMHRIVYTVDVMQSSWPEVTVKSVEREIRSLNELTGSITSEDLLEMIEHYLWGYTDAFAGLGDVGVEFRVLTEKGRNALHTAVTKKRDRLKANTAELDAYIKSHFGDDSSSLRKS